MDIKFPDFTKLTWPLNVALVSAIFSTICSIYNPSFIYYGFITFVYGIICHLVDTTYGFWLKNKGITSGFVFISQGILTLIWVVVLIFL